MLIPKDLKEKYNNHFELAYSLYTKLSYLDSTLYATLEEIRYHTTVILKIRNDVSSVFNIKMYLNKRPVPMDITIDLSFYSTYHNDYESDNPYLHWNEMFENYTFSIKDSKGKLLKDFKGTDLHTIIEKLCKYVDNL